MAHPSAAAASNATADDVISPYEPYEFLQDQPVVSSFLILVLVLASTVGTAGNILILVSVATQRDLQNVESVFIVNLACSDLYVTAIADPLSIVGKVLGWRFFATHPELCRAVGSLCTVSCVGSLMTISTVSLNRYILITHHHLYRRLFTLLTTVILCVSFYLMGLMFVVLNFAGVGDHSFDHRSLECIWDRMANHSYTRAFSVVGVMLPILVTGLCYARLYLRVRKSRMKIHHHSNSNNVEPSPSTGMRTAYGRQRNEELRSAPGNAAFIPRDSRGLGAEADKNDNKTTQGVNPSSNLGRGSPPGGENLSSSAAAGVGLYVSRSSRTSPSVREVDVKVGEKRESGGRGSGGPMKLARTVFIIYMVFSACWLPFAVLLVIEDGQVASQKLHLLIVAWAHLHPSLNWLVYYHTHSKFRAAFRKLLHLDRCCR